MTQTAKKKYTRARVASVEGPDPVDVHVGQRIYLRRRLLSMTQEQMASALGVSFQQVQKYERGSNRVSASRLYDIARALAVPVSFFFDDIPSDIESTRGPDTSQGFFAQNPETRTESLRLLRAFWALNDEQRTALLALAEGMSGG